MSNDIDFISPYTTTNRIKRMIWIICWTILAKPFPKSLANRWKIFLLRCFGAQIANNAHVYSSAKIFMPWNLIMEEHSCIASGVDCYNAALITIKKYATVSQRSYLCTASHNISSSRHEQIEKPIVIEERAWVAAEAFIGPGVIVGEGAVVGARAAVFKDVAPWTVVGGNPAKYIKDRIINK
ncbi:putative colanic acid biosynthesis acetyltransferase [Phocaeicola plebeius]|jgi:putative colanic acid biosynthesis acetyltransferase WcaF|uniref:Putative colanic acid biosynthesis acetyltransferase n=1 Tax=Phocaeicola plebeius TaxID=310297 RepID=A0A414RF54_9BACT|nr:putative colanic acid biosynthesis acetyltransferase [Phocaeicola plebeius]RHF91684.1 putative colanic acid biosynthesis acetyltransferase [Phocaeicola plebeius]